MRKPKPEEKRASLYAIDVIDTVGTYVGETDTKIVLNLGDKTVRLYDWANVTPVQMRETDG